MRPRSLRALISLFVAVVFAIAAQPGTMAMPAMKAAVPHVMTMTMDGAASMASCDHMKPQKQPGNPCKNMAVCLGMLSCYGIAVVGVAHVMPLPMPRDPQMAIGHEPISGLTLQPDNPPPIA